jgi:tetratricopeptide (TPR) repeat protein
VGGYFIYKNFVQAPAAEKAAEASFKAEQYYGADSTSKQALEGDGTNLGFVKLAEKYSGTPTGELAKFRAGTIYLKMEDYKNAIKYLQNVTLDSKPIQARAYCCLADAYSSSGKEKEAAELYVKAGNYFPEDDEASSEYLYRGGMLYDKLNDTKKAIEVFTMIKDKYARTNRAANAEKYLGKLGALN